MLEEQAGNKVSQVKWDTGEWGERVSGTELTGRLVWLDTELLSHVLHPINCNSRLLTAGCLTYYSRLTVTAGC